MSKENKIENLSDSKMQEKEEILVCLFPRQSAIISAQSDPLPSLSLYQPRKGSANWCEETTEEEERDYIRQWQDNPQWKLQGTPQAEDSDGECGPKAGKGDSIAVKDAINNGAEPGKVDGTMPAVSIVNTSNDAGEAENETPYHREDCTARSSPIEQSPVVSPTHEKHAGEASPTSSIDSTTGMTQREGMALYEQLMAPSPALSREDPEAGQRILEKERTRFLFQVDGEVRLSAIPDTLEQRLERHRAKIHYLRSQVQQLSEYSNGYKALYDDAQNLRTLYDAACREAEIQRAEHNAAREEIEILGEANRKGAAGYAKKMAEVKELRENLDAQTTYAKELGEYIDELEKEGKERWVQLKAERIKYQKIVQELEALQSSYDIQVPVVDAETQTGGNVMDGPETQTNSRDVANAGTQINRVGFVDGHTQTDGIDLATVGIQTESVGEAQETTEEAVDRFLDHESMRSSQSSKEPGKRFSTYELELQEYRAHGQELQRQRNVLTNTVELLASRVREVQTSRDILLEILFDKKRKGCDQCVQNVFQRLEEKADELRRCRENRRQLHKQLDEAKLARNNAEKSLHEALAARQNLVDLCQQYQKVTDGMKARAGDLIKITEGYQNENCKLKNENHKLQDEHRKLEDQPKKCQEEVSKLQNKLDRPKVRTIERERDLEHEDAVTQEPEHAETLDGQSAGDGEDFSRPAAWTEREKRIRQTDAFKARLARIHQEHKRRGLRSGNG